MFEDDLMEVLDNGTNVWYSSGFGAQFPSKFYLTTKGNRIELPEEDALKLARLIFSTFDRSISEERKQHGRVIWELRDLLKKFTEDHKI